ncbi:MAG: hypothetical protein JXR75_06880 [Rhodobacteraceae bacterium]|nr:hypothetical protein [Paracoccaceae bacterium]
MVRSSVFMAAPVMALLMCGTAQAALTVDQVWADLQAQAIAGGLKITVATEVPGDRELTLNGVSIAPDGGPAIATVSEISLVEQEDGSVALFPGEIRLENTGPARVTVYHEDLSLSMYEDAGGMGYGLDADSLKISVVATEGAGQTAKSFDGTFDLTGIAGRYTRGLEALGFGVSAGRLVYDIKQEDAALGIDSAQVSDTADVDLTGEMTLPEGMDLMSLKDAPAVFAAARAGLGMVFEATQGVSSGDLVDNNPMMPMSLAFQAKPGTTSMVLNADEFGFDTSVEGMSFTARPPMVPGAVNATTDAFEMAFAMPMVAVEEAGEYALTLGVANLALDDGAWRMIDPAGALDHGPADLTLDMGGLARIDTLELMQANEAGRPPQVMPELQTLDIRALAVKLAGAALSGTGAFTFDNSMVAAGGPPMPLGTADLRLEGGNNLIDGLIAMGLMTADDAMGARMMMAMFGKPAGDDVLTSTIEAREGGSIFVNGQQIQ